MLGGKIRLENKWIWIKSILIPVLIGGFVGILVSQFMDYNTLQKPTFSPPGFLFGIVWTILYILMGISYGILKSKNLLNSEIKWIYYLQLFVNAMWSIIFFIWKWRFFAFLWIILLDVLVIILIIKFYQKNKISGLLQIPYLLWTLFASYLNLSIYLLNK